MENQINKQFEEELMRLHALDTMNKGISRMFDKLNNNSNDE